MGDRYLLIVLDVQDARPQTRDDALGFARILAAARTQTVIVTGPKGGQYAPETPAAWTVNPDRSVQAIPDLGDVDFPFLPE